MYDFPGLTSQAEHSLELGNFGVMQGRLLAPEGSHFQAHPVGRWQKEFELAGQIGFGYIEFIVDQWSVRSNPVLSGQGVREIQQVCDSTGVSVRSICLDALMEWKLHSTDQSEVEVATNLLLSVIRSAETIGASVVVLPCVDNSRLEDEALGAFVEKLEPICGVALKSGIQIALETDLPPQKFRGLLDRFVESTVWVNYDIGNSASLGFDPREELRLYGDYIVDVHVKDRKLGGFSVPLGTGHADLEFVICELEQKNYDGPIVFQAWRGEHGWPDLKPQIEYFKSLLSKTWSK